MPLIKDKVHHYNTNTIISHKEASRFLAQATLGYDYEAIETVAKSGFQTWLNQQFTQPRESMVESVRTIEKFLHKKKGGLFGVYQFRSAWWNQVLNSPDTLRQRVAYALSQIFVISAVGSDLFEDVNMISASYYDILSKHAFGNYRDLLAEVSRSLPMGVYLSHLHNPKADRAKNIHPDENYAREIMQLFSIGLYELNNDGSHKKDALGKSIATYNNKTIREFAKIFTGFGCGSDEAKWNEDFEELEKERLEKELFTPMKMYDEWHEQGSKLLLRGKVVPGGQSGIKDFNDAIDNLFYHPNVGPFIGKALIQLLVSANPSPAYINRVANAFNNNGKGTRGDMKAVIRAVLLDKEARTPDMNPYAGKLREPIVRYTGFLRAFKAEAKKGVFINAMFKWHNQTGQVPLFAPSVFNFYSPNYQPNGSIAAKNLVAPTFQIHDASTSIGFINEVNDWLFNDMPFGDEEDRDEVKKSRVEVFLNYEDELELLEEPVKLVDHLDVLLACGQLSAKTKKIISNAVAKIPDNRNKLQMAIYLVMISPEYAVLK